MINEVVEDFLTMLFPRYCLMCKDSLVKAEEHICLHCQYNLPFTNYHLRPENDLAKRFLGKIHLKHALAYLKFIKGGKVQRILHQLKYNGKPGVGELMGRWYGVELANHGYHKEFDLIVPVPLHLAKLKARGYNQCDPFAKGLSEILQVEWDAQLLYRVKASETQTKKKRFARWENVNTIFQIDATKDIQGKRILIVDDVITTGATLEACAQIILDHGGKEVSVAAIASAQ
jgi:ComF family protein